MGPDDRHDDSPSAATEPMPVVAERYELIELVGAGGMGRVYRAYDRFLEEHIALKLMTSVPCDAAGRRFIQREVRLARRIRHPNVVRVHDLGFEEDTPFVTMELLEGRPLSAFIERRMPIPWAVRVAAAIADGLQAAHDVSVVHRDLKPANVIVNESGRATITDFGIARLFGAEAPASVTALVGTPRYMAPEQARGQALDGRTDVFSLGLVLYELLTGCRAFPDGSLMESLAQRLEAPPPDIRDHVSIPDPLADLVMRCACPQPEGRPGCAAEVAEALRRLSRAESIEASVEPTPSASVRIAPAPPQPRFLAVVPFDYDGEQAVGSVARGLGRQLAEYLSRSDGLYVVSAAAVRQRTDDDDEGALADLLGASLLVRGCVTMAEGRANLTLTLSDLDEGRQSRLGTHERPRRELLELACAGADDVATALGLAWRAPKLPPCRHDDSAARYLDLRARLSATSFDARRNLAMAFAELSRGEPELGLPQAACAIACIGAWWAARTEVPPWWGEVTRYNVAQALIQAPGLSDTHLAAGMLAVQEGDVAAAVESLMRALRLAPNNALAQQYLGSVEAEAGHPDGERRLRMAVTLDTSTTFLCHLTLFVRATLRGDRDAAELSRRTLVVAESEDHPVLRWQLARRAAWTRDRQALSAIARWTERQDEPAKAFLHHYVRVAGGLGGPDLLLGALDRATPRHNRRFAATMLQYASEALALGGHVELAERRLEHAAELGLFDLPWLTTCPAIESLRGRDVYQRAVERVRPRVAAIWRAIEREQRIG